MFKATLADVGLLTDSISTIAELIDEGLFKLGKDGIGLLAADRALVAVVDFKIMSSAFEKYEADEEKSIGLNITNLLSILKRASAEDKATFTLADSKLEIVLQNASRRRFVLPLLDLSQEEVPPIDQLEFAVSAELKPSVLQSGIADAEIVADSVLFEASPSRFGMRAEGDISSAQLELERGNASLIVLTAETEVKSRYPLDYLKKIIKAAKIAESVKLNWGQDYPMKLEFKSKDKVILNTVLAPRVSEE
ncbi:MAG TPA: proliferating cell nuclear antigen (pcna) [archaeon]|nr:proliferating cell nuclear antigen (pcna) [archaeon]